MVWQCDFVEFDQKSPLFFIIANNIGAAMKGKSGGEGGVGVKIIIGLPILTYKTFTFHPK